MHVHIGNLAAQTGVTRFTQINDHWTYSKNESLEPHQLQQYTHLLIEAKSKYSPNLKSFSNTHVIVESIEAFSQISLNYKLIPPVKIKTKPSLFILERKDFRETIQGQIIKDVDSRENIEEHDSSQASAEESVTSDESYKLTESSEIEINNLPPSNNDKVDELTDVQSSTITEEVSNEETVEMLDDKGTYKFAKAKRAIDDFKTLRMERKQRAIAKIKSETRKEVVASAKEKLKEIMKRHQHIADELSENIISEVKTEFKDSELEVDNIQIVEEEIMNVSLDEIVDTETTDANVVEETTKSDDLLQSFYILNRTDENINAIVEEVIVRLIDRKMYDDKTKPEDIKSEDRQMIQQIVEEVLSEKMNYSSSIRE